MAGESGVLKEGVTNDLVLRVGPHKDKMIRGFTNPHNVTKLAGYEPHQGARTAIAREKETKGWRRPHFARNTVGVPTWKVVPEVLILTEALAQNLKQSLRLEIPKFQ